jgi:phosphoglycolate phosphatase
LFENKVYEGIPEVLRDLAGRIPLYVASSKPLVFVDQILAHFSLDGFFTQTFGSGLDGSLADKSELLAHALSQTGVDAQGALMIGDRRHDAVGAQTTAWTLLVRSTAMATSMSTEPQVSVAGYRRRRTCSL